MLRQCALEWTMPVCPASHTFQFDFMYAYILPSYSGTSSVSTPLNEDFFQCTSRSLLPFFFSLCLSSPFQPLQSYLICPHCQFSLGSSVFFPRSFRTPFHVSFSCLFFPLFLPPFRYLHSLITYVSLSIRNPILLAGVRGIIAGKFLGLADARRRVLAQFGKNSGLIISWFHASKLE
jgi:hypothetical protein